MFEIQGKNNSATIFIDTVDETTIAQIYGICNEAAFAGTKIRIMPDTHAGAGCVIGTTMTILDKIVPNLVGVDISCGVLVVPLNMDNIDLEALDKVIHQVVPSGMNCHSSLPKAALAKNREMVEPLICKNAINIDKAIHSIGTLGGGNHYIEIDQDSDTKELYLVIHTGSRNLGKRMAEHYQDIAKTHMSKRPMDSVEEMNKAVDKLKSENRFHEISETIKAFKTKTHQCATGMEYLDSFENGFENYIHDMKIAQAYAHENRLAIANAILNDMFKTDVSKYEWFETLHNYIDMDNMILRKGAISAQAGEKCVIPLNMRDGMLICKGKGNPDWNFSAPHGAGRLYSRSSAKVTFSLEEFKDSMTGIFSTTVGMETIDESPMAYKNADVIKSCIEPTVEILAHVKPIYNFKAAEKSGDSWKEKKQRIKEARKGEA